MDWIDRIRRSAELEMMEKELDRLRIGPPDSPVEYLFKGQRWLRMSRWARERRLETPRIGGKT
jgi:hypothetical protein